MKLVFVAAFSAASLIASAAPAATLVHAYDFSSGVTDKVGTANGTLLNGASISGGALQLDGVNDYVQFNTKLVDTSQAFSLFMSFSTTGQTSNLVEIISQGYSGQPGFYVGIYNGGLRLTDNYSNGTIGVPQNGQFHNLLVTSTASQSRVWLDGVLSFTGQSLLANMSGGDNTRLGQQFGTYGEFYRGSLDNVLVYNGVATYSEAVAAASAVPEPSTWMSMLVGFGLLGAMLRRARRTGHALQG